MKLVILFSWGLVFSCLDIDIAAEVDKNYCVLWEAVKKQQQTCQTNAHTQSNISKTLDQQTDAIDNLRNHMTALQNETRESLKDLTCKLETQTMKLEKLQLIEENRILNGTLVEVTSSKTNCEEVNEQLQNQIIDMHKTMEDTKLNYEKELQKLRDQNEVLNNELVKRNDSVKVSDGSHPGTCTQLSQSGRWVSDGHRINDSFRNLISRVQDTQTKYDMYNFKHWTLRMAIINDKLWVSVWGNDTIQILDTDDVNRVKEITHTDIQYPRIVGYDNHGHVLLCCHTGLHLLDLQGSYVHKIEGGLITDIHIDCNVAYVYNYSNNNVVTLKYRNSSWVKTDTFLAIKSSREGLNTLLVVDNTIYVCSRFRHVIHTYTLTGTYIRKYGRYGSNMPGHLDLPHLCGIDSNKSVIVCENSGLQVLLANGSWQKYVLQGVANVCNIVMDTRGNIWILYSDKISKFRV